MEFGDITILKNICFSDGVVDHSYRLGRPCIYIGEDLNHMYFVPLANLNSKIKEKQFVIAPKVKNNLTKKSRIRASELITRPVAFYELYGRLDYFDIQKLIESLRFFYSYTYNLIGFTWRKLGSLAMHCRHGGNAATPGWRIQLPLP